MANILLVEDEANVRDILSLSLNSFGHDVVACANPNEAEVHLLQVKFDVVITDLRMDGKDAGLDVVRMAKSQQPTAPVLLLTAYASTETAVEAMREGAFDYITKPVSRTELGDIVEQALLSRNTSPKQCVGSRDNASQKLVGDSALMLRVHERLERAAKRNFTVLITGESGTGKELAARMVHQSSARVDKPFMPVHCGAIPENLFESEIFGYVKGAFTGADKDKIGLIQSADKGTLFLDEIGEMPLHIQVKLLRVLQDMKIRPVGSAQEIQVDVRIIAATNRDLAKEVQLGNFREDLFYRLNVIPVHMPALRQRRADIPAIVSTILKRLGYPNIKISNDAMSKISSLPLAGNVRELENTLQRMLALSDDSELDIEILQEFETPQSDTSVSLESMNQENITLDQQLEKIEKTLLEEALIKSNHNVTKAAKLLGIGFRSIRYRLEKLGLKGSKD
ncbi:MAG: sigma-54 dependent transcriptional regulator [Ghiorsea sp.]